MKKEESKTSEQEELRAALDVLKNRVENLDALINKKLKDLGKAPRGSLHVMQKQGRRPQYYWRKDPKEKSGKYLRREQIDLAEKLAQKEYDEKIIKAAGLEIEIIRDFLKKYKEDRVLAVYREMNEVKRDLIIADEIPDDEYVNNWINAPYTRKGFKEGYPEFYSMKGERVRSKSEIIIANCLEKEGIPYKYECPLILNNGNLIHPDFTVLNTRERKVFYWEHFGMLDDRDYLKKNLNRLSDYEENGIILGKNLIITCETMYYPLNTRHVFSKISNFLK